MDSIMEFLQKWVGRFMGWWEGLIDWPVTHVKGIVIKWSFVGLVLMFIFLIWLGDAAWRWLT